jgi:mono/diheme cytochrome c family protein
MKRVAPMLALALLAACEGMGSSRGPDLERMIDQEKAEAFEPSPFLPNGRVMQVPPEGTVPRERVLGDPALTEGVVDGKLLDAIPIPMSAPLLMRGRDRYDIYCAPCHGVLGDGDSEVARRMELRRPPSLVDLQPLPYTAVGPNGEPMAPTGNRYGPGGIFRVITEGFGLMPNYRNELPPADRWAVVAYVRALTVSQRSTLDGLPPDLRQEGVQKLQEGTR